MNKKPIHYNVSIKPEKYKLPACQVGGNWERNFSTWQITTDKDKITCKRCRKILGAN